MEVMRSAIVTLAAERASDTLEVGKESDGRLHQVSQTASTLQAFRETMSTVMWRP